MRHYMNSFSALAFVMYSTLAYKYGLLAATMCWASVPAMLLGLWFVASLIIWWEYFRAPERWQPRQPLWLTLVLPASCSGLIELLQAYATTCRSGDWLDFLFNAAGVILAALFVRLFRKEP